MNNTQNIEETRLFRTTNIVIAHYAHLSYHTIP